MDTELWVRRACAAAIPALLLVAFWIGSRSSDEPPAEAKPNPTPASSSAAAQAKLGERAFAKAEPPPPPAPAQPAAGLPFADDAQRGDALRRGPVAARSAPSGPCGGVTVRLITASPDPDWAFVSIAPTADDPAAIKRIGERVGGWRVSAIEWDRVWLSSGGSKCAVGMHLGAREAAEAVGALKPGKKPLLEAVDAPPWYLPSEIAEAIEQGKDHELVIQDQAVQAIFEQAGTLLAGLRLEPLHAGERVVGLRLEDVKSDSLLEHLGIESGDVLLALNDTPLASLDGALDALRDARREGSLVARLERQGETFDLRVRVR